jgi:hypothetical protein
MAVGHGMQARTIVDMGSSGFLEGRGKRIAFHFGSTPEKTLLAGLYVTVATILLA